MTEATTHLAELPQPHIEATDTQVNGNAFYALSGLTNREKREIPVDQSDLALPPGFSYTDPTTVSFEELSALMHEAGLAGDSSAAVERRDMEFRYWGLTQSPVAIRSQETNELVGYACLFSVGENGLLGDLAVATAYRGQGLGRKLIDARLKIAESQGITSLYIDDLKETNNLATYYLEKGFRKMDDLLVRGPNPISLEDALVIKQRAEHQYMQHSGSNAY